MATTCPKCSAPVDPAAMAAPDVGERAKAIFLDWRVWVFAVVLNVVVGMINGVLHTSGTGFQLLAGAGIGVFIALRMGKLRKCPSCSRVVVPATSA